MCSQVSILDVYWFTQTRAGAWLSGTDCSKRKSCVSVSPPLGPQGVVANAETVVLSLGQGRLLKKEMATHLL